MPEKGARLLPPILKLVRRQFPDAQLLVVGSVWFGETTSNGYVRQVQHEARTLGDAIRFAGFLPPASIPRVLGAADVLVAPGQWYEPSGRFVIEALAAGVPLVTSPRGGTTLAAVDGRTALVIHDYRRPEAYAALSAASFRTAPFEQTDLEMAGSCRAILHLGPHGVPTRQAL